MTSVRTPSPSPWVETVGRLWPDATVSQVRRPRRGPDPAPPGARELVFLPDARRARLLLPAHHPAAAAAALRRYSHDLGVAARVARWGLATAVRTGLPQRALADRVTIRAGTRAGESIEDRLAALLGRPVVVSVGLGSARANRKPILHVLTPAGEPLAFVKVGDGPATRDLVRAEADRLRWLAGRPLRRLAVPAVLRLESWHDLDLLVLSALPTRARPGGSRRRLRAAMRELYAVDGNRRAELAASPYWAGLVATPDLLDDPEQAAGLGGVLEEFAAVHGRRELDFGAWHGDWTPWNMSWHRGVVQLWDFERFERSVPAGFDPLHYRFQQAMRAGADPDGLPDLDRWAAGCAADLDRAGVARAGAGPTRGLYLIELCRRYLLAAQTPIGAPLRGRAARLLAALREDPPWSREGWR